MARIGMDWSRRDETERTLSAWRRFAPTVPVWGFDPFFPLCFSSPSLLRSFPMTGSSCSAHPVSFPNVVQRQPLLCPWPFYSVKIAGPENVTAKRREKTVRNHSFPEHSPENTLSEETMVTQRLAALRSHGSRFWGVEEAIKPPFWVLVYF